MTRFFDTHAILGVLKGEARYRHLVRTAGYTHQMNVLEALVHLTRAGDARPLHTVQRLGLGLVDATEDDLVAAATFKTEAQHREKNFSYVDALGFAVARRLGLSFVTGDPGFQGLEGVELAKPSA